jgi:osmotically-inducible protein OsmY
MFKRNRQSPDDSQRYSRSENAGYDERFGPYGMRGPRRSMEGESDFAGSYSDYSSFEGTTNRPYFGGEEGRFPYGGSQDFSNERNSWNADERSFSGNWMRGTHAGKGPKGYRRSDARIQEEVCDLLTENPDIDASEIEVNVKGCVVTVAGSVENRRIKRMVEDLVENVNGVVDVRNELRVSLPGISSEMPREAESDRISTSASSSKSHAVGSRDRSSHKQTKSSQSASRRMNS